jgi:predicted small secreted protein
MRSHLRILSILLLAMFLLAACATTEPVVETVGGAAVAEVEEAAQEAAQEAVEEAIAQPEEAMVEEEVAEPEPEVVEPEPEVIAEIAPEDLDAAVAAFLAGMEKYNTIGLEDANWPRIRLPSCSTSARSTRSLRRATSKVRSSSHYGNLARI